jgi:hemolysin activation/secretion protein
MSTISKNIFLLMLLAFSYRSVFATETQTYAINGISEQEFADLQIDMSKPLIDVVQHMVHGLEQNGFFLATVTVTENHVIVVDKGLVSRVEISGLDEKAEKQARAYLSAAISTAPNINSFDRALALINDMPGVSASMVFERDATQGDFTVVISAYQYSNFGGLSLDSSPRNLFQQNRLSLQQSLNNVFTGGDIVRAQGSFVHGDSKPDQRSLYVDYEFPIGASGLYAEASLGDVNTETALTGPSSLSFVTGTGFVLTPGRVTRHNFDGQLASFTLAYPLIREHDTATYLISDFDYSKDKTEGVGDTIIRIAELGAMHSFYSPAGWSYVVSMMMAVGETASYLDAYDGNFRRMQLHAGYILPFKLISAQTELRLEAYGQLSSVDTPNALLLSLGDEDFLRGYESSTFVGNNGTIFTAELARPIALTDSFAEQVTSFVFVDAGYVDNPTKWQMDRRPAGDTLVSAGVGADVYLTTNLAVYGYLAAPLSETYETKTPSPRAYLRLNWSC